ncbi:MAG TPA: FAD-binding oxidoreductase [Roseiarcus sp.]
MAQPTSDKIKGFVSTFKGKALTAGDPEYDSSRAVWNGAIDRKPAVIARCADAQQAASAVRFARKGGLEISVRGGGHNYAGTAVGDGGLMVHLGAMNQVSVDTAARRVRCGGGATWGDLDAATQSHGLATPGGIISHTGVAGLALGGGIGWLTKKAGLSCDNLLAAEVVTADGRIVQASRDANPDLLWALKGGGGNFGIATSFEFALHPVGPMVQLALLFVGLESGAPALRLVQEQIDALPDDANGFLAIGMSAPPEPFVPEQYRGKIGHGVIIVGFGSPEEHAKAVAPLRDAVRPLWELVTPMPYVALQRMFDESAHWGTLAYEKALYVGSLSDGALSVIGDHVPRKKSPISFVPTFRLSGKYLAANEADTAFGGSRSPVYVLNIAAHIPPGAPRELYAEDRAWVRSFWDAMRPYATGAGSYVNFIADAEEDRVKASYGAEKYARLARIKREWDPDNAFHRNVNIKPA